MPRDELHPADNYGPDNTWYTLACYSKTRFRGSRDTCILSGFAQNNCHILTSYRNCAKKNFFLHH